jgi:hypothetical protein
MSNFETVKSYLDQMGLSISSEDAAEELVVIDDPSQGLNHLVIDCEDPILILEQHLFKLRDASNAPALFRLLQLNRELVHGAFAIDDSGQHVLFRDTLQLTNLDLNELEGSIQALSLALAENANELLSIAKG